MSGYVRGVCESLRHCLLCWCDRRELVYDARYMIGDYFIFIESGWCRHLITAEVEEVFTNVYGAIQVYSKWVPFACHIF